MKKSQTYPLLFFFIGVVSPYAVVEGGGEAQPGQIWRHEQGSSAADGIPRHHGGCDGPSEEHNLNQSLDFAETEHNTESSRFFIWSRIKNIKC